MYLNLHVTFPTFLTILTKFVYYTQTFTVTTIPNFTAIRTVGWVETCGQKDGRTWWG